VEVTEQAGGEEGGDGGGPLGRGEFGREEWREVVEHGLPQGGAGRCSHPYLGTTPSGGKVTEDW